MPHDFALSSTNLNKLGTPCDRARCICSCEQSNERTPGLVPNCRSGIYCAIASSSPVTSACPGSLIYSNASLRDVAVQGRRPRVRSDRVSNPGHTYHNTLKSEAWVPRLRTLDQLMGTWHPSRRQFTTGSSN